MSDAALHWDEVAEIAASISRNDKREVEGVGVGSPSNP
jgi:hypothetical protein